MTMRNELPLTPVYLVTISTQYGEHRKETVKRLVTAPLPTLACHFAILTNAIEPDKLEWDKNGAIESTGEFAYKAKSQPVNPNHLSVLTEYLELEIIDYKQLQTSGNYPEIMGAIEYAHTVDSLLNDGYHVPNKSWISDSANTVFNHYETGTSVFNAVEDVAKENHFSKKK